jgi:hypothetical protein
MSDEMLPPSRAYLLLEAWSRDLAKQRAGSHAAGGFGRSASPKEGAIAHASNMLALAHGFVLLRQGGIC